MTIDGTGLVKLMTWLSPAFPVGGFSYSSGLEWAVRSEVVTDARALETWIDNLLDHGSAWSDAVLFAEAWRSQGDEDRLGQIVELARALSSSAERLLETTQLGSAFAIAAKNWGKVSTAAPYPIAVGKIAGQHAIDLHLALPAFLHALVANLVSAAVRLIPLGQSEGVAVMARLAGKILATAERAADSTLDDLGSFAFIADIATMKHETLEPRLFRT